MCILIELSLFWVEPGGKSTKREQRFSRCSLSLLVCHKARNTIDENVFRLCGVQTLSALVECVKPELNTLIETMLTHLLIKIFYFFFPVLMQS